MAEQAGAGAQQVIHEERDARSSMTSAAPRQSGEHQQVYAVRDLPRPRAITPINLGFGTPEASPAHPTSAGSTIQSSRSTSQTQAPRASPLPPLKNDPRRPLPSTANQPASADLHREASEASTGSSLSKLERVDKSSSEWEVLSEAGSRLNEGEVVEELQKKVDKRRSNFQYLENELAELDAQLKAAEERLAKAQDGLVGPDDTTTALGRQ